MTWDQLIKKIREGLGESGARIRVVGELLAKTGDDGVMLNQVQVDGVLTVLTLAASDLHSVVEHVAIGLDAVVEILREDDKSQEVKGE